jgi:peptide/nickel transport system substrate-binding protein
MGEHDRDDIVRKLIESARSKGLSRRRFIQGTLAAGLGVSAGSALWSSKVWAQTPKRGGVFRVGVHDGNTSDSLDPGTTEAVYMIHLNHISRSYLTEITNENDVGPDAALSWEASADASEWRFELANNIEFHSGKKFTSDDAIASLNYHRGEDSKSAAKTLLTDVEDIRKDGDHAIIIKMVSGNADLPYLLSDYHLVMLPVTPSGDVDWQSGDGTGPYKIVHHEAGIGTELTRHEAYHREDQAFFDGIKLTVLNDANARQTALLTDDVDAISDVDLKTVRLLGRDPNIELDEVPSGAHATIPMFCDVAPFDNLDFRLALKYAINREEINQKILFNYGSIGNDHPIAPSLPYYAELEQRTYDLDKAKFHLKKSGHEGATIELSAADTVFPGAVDMCSLFREQAAPAGNTIHVKREPNDGYWSNVWLVKPFVVVQWGARPTPDVMFSLAYKEGAEWNESHWVNPTFNKLLLEAKAELDQAKRAEMYHEMQLLCRDDGGTIVPFFRNRLYARQKRVQHGPSLAGNWELDGARAYQRWWFES